MGAYQHIEYEVGDGIATITFAREEKLNAYIPEMGDEIVAAFAAAEADDEARAVIMTGRGRAYCAGVDLDYLKAHMSGESMGSGPKLGQEAFVRDWPLALVAFPKPVIAAINGPAYGVGVTMTLGCDVRIAAHGARLALNFTKLGMLPGLGSTHLLPQLVGMAKALELVLSAATITAEEAERIGLVQHCVPPEALLPEARALATRMAAQDPEVLAAAKQALRSGAQSDMASAMELERELSGRLQAGRRRS